MLWLTWPSSGNTHYMQNTWKDICSIKLNKRMILHFYIKDDNVRSRVIKPRRLRWAGHVARMAEGRGVHKVLVGKPDGKSHWVDEDVDERIILRWIFRKWEGVVGTGWSWLWIGTGGGHL